MLGNIDPHTIRKIAVLRANALGDFIFIIPALQALRETFPDSEIILLGKQWHADYVPRHVPAVDRVIVVPPYPGVGGPEDAPRESPELQAFFEAMQAERFDIALQMHGGGGNSNPFLSRLGARMTVGLQAPDAPSLDISIPYVFYHLEVHRYLEVVRAIGAQTAHIVPRITVLPSDRQTAQTFLTNAGIQQPYIVLHPGASDPRRRWSAVEFAAVAARLIDKGYAVVVSGVGDEAAVVAEVLKHEPRAVSAANALTLDGFTGLLAEAVLVISNDTGPLHLAAAVGTPTVGIYWFANMFTAAQINRSNHRPLISFTIACPVCGAPSVDSYQTNKRYCEHNDSFVTDVPTARVLEEAESLLGNH
ncbi:MAG TPA: glycosyltransferase family 9 protein [Candidatus Limnocylindrales bacterium]|nr:glycosyltransferase family 9 protein [Candidatus Limnocylindrales bacterium]